MSERCSERVTISKAHTTAMMIPCSSVFIYGTLMAPQVLKGLIGRVPDLVKPAILSNYRRHPVKEHVFPGIIPCSTGASTTKGLLLEGLSENELKVLDWYEGEEYIRRDVKVKCDGISHETQCYVWSNPLSELDLTQGWDYDTFRETKLDWYLATTVQPCRLELDDLGIGKYNS